MFAYPKQHQRDEIRTALRGRSGPAAVALDRPHLGPIIATLGWLRQAREELEQLDPGRTMIAPAIRALTRTEAKIVEPVRIAILGEFNSGKTTLANYLIGFDGLPTAILSNTAVPTRVSYAQTPFVVGWRADGSQTEITLESDVDSRTLASIDVGLPIPRLLDFSIIDLPAYAGSQSAQRIALGTGLHPDITIWCSASTQAWRESERRCWVGVSPHMKRRTILAVTFADLLSGPEERAQVLARVHDSARESFGETVMLSALDGLEAMAAEGNQREWLAALAGVARLDAVIEQMSAKVMEERAEAARKLAGRIASRTLEQLQAGAAV
jgi:hypothetical protein